MHKYWRIEYGAALFLRLWPMALMQQAHGERSNVHRQYSLSTWLQKQLTTMPLNSKAEGE